jgi:hypothetical protein
MGGVIGIFSTFQVVILSEKQKASELAKNSWNSKSRILPSKAAGFAYYLLISCNLYFSPLRMITLFICWSEYYRRKQTAVGYFKTSVHFFLLQSFENDDVVALLVPVFKLQSC